MRPLPNPPPLRKGGSEQGRVTRLGKLNNRWLQPATRPAGVGRLRVAIPAARTAFRAECNMCVAMDWLRTLRQRVHG